MDPRIASLQVLLERHRSDLDRAVATVPPTLRDTRPQDGGWSVANVLEHLVGTEGAVTKLLDGLLAGAASRPAGVAFDRDAFERALDMPAFLDRTRKLRGRQPAGDMTADEAWRALGESRAALFAFLARADGRMLEETERAHPITGTPLDGYQWVAFVALHEGRHARQIEEIGSSLSPEDAAKG